MIGDSWIRVSTSRVMRISMRDRSRVLISHETHIVITFTQFIDASTHGLTTRVISRLLENPVWYRHLHTICAHTHETPYRVRLISINYNNISTDISI